MVIYRYTLPTFFLFVSYGICRGKEREKKYLQDQCEKEEKEKEIRRNRRSKMTEEGNKMEEKQDDR